MAKPKPIPELIPPELTQTFFRNLPDFMGDSCWNWNGTCIPPGYGRVHFNSLFFSAHRLAFRIFVGAIPEGLFVCHRCDNPSCCRPDHLFLGTQLDNMRDKMKKGRCGCRYPFPSTELIEAVVKMFKPRKVTAKTVAGKFGMTEGAVKSMIHRYRYKNKVSNGF